MDARPSHLAYGLVLVLFGIMIRLLLWPLNQKGMRASIKMQAIQPEMKALQDRHKDDPQALQAEMFKLYKDHHVNPFSGCWPMLLPWPVLLALFFVFQNTIELRGQSFPVAAGSLAQGSALHSAGADGPVALWREQGRADWGWSRIRR